jgi:hypothetical protein
LFQLISTFVQMKINFRHIISILLLGLFLAVKVISVHSVMHLIEGDDLIVENCIDCEYQLQINEVPVLQSQIAEIPTITFSSDSFNLFYSSPFISNIGAYYFSNKAPPSLA